MSDRDDSSAPSPARAESAGPDTTLLQRSLLQRAPQWGEAYLLFDGEYSSLDDLLRSCDD